MDAATWGFIGVVVGGVITGVVTIGVEALRLWQGNRADSGRRKDDRRIERERFQRETLVALQPAIHGYLEQVAGAYVQARDARPVDPEAPRSSLPVHPPLRAAMVPLVQYASRVDDDELRQMVDVFMGLCDSVLTAGSQRAADDAADKATSMAAVMTFKAGDLIRATFRRDD